MNEIEHKKIDSISSTEYVNVINLLMHWNKKIEQQTIVEKKKFGDTLRVPNSFFFPVSLNNYSTV